MYSITKKWICFAAEKIVLR